MKNDANDFKGLNAFALMFFIIILAGLMTYFIPAGSYERVEVDNRSIVNPESFSYTESEPVGPLELFNSFHMGMVEGANIILFVFLFGGALGIMEKTGAIEALVKMTTAKFHSKEKVLIPILILLFSLLGSLIGSAEDALIYIAIIMPLTIALRLDALTGFAIVFLGILGTGFTSGITNPFSVGVAQIIAELPMYSGIAIRIAIFILFYTVTVIFIFRHVNSIKKNPALAVYGKYSSADIPKIDYNYKMKKSNALSLIIFALGFGLLIYGVIALEWYIGEIAGVFLMSAVLMGIISRLSPNSMADGFIKGSKDMVSGALIIGFAQTILVILESGHLLDTILHFSANILDTLPTTIAAAGMFITQLFINLVVPSGSGQAALTMPVMSPLADLLGITRQTAIVAFQLGDGISNTIIPTSGVLLASLSIAGIPYMKWVKWILPYFIIQTILGIIIVMIAQTFQLGPF